MKCDWITCKDEATHGPYCFNHHRVYGEKKVVVNGTSNSIPQLLEKAQKVFNAWVRDRDRPFGCITCSNSVEDAGHYIPVGENIALRFTETNVWGQCRSCNVSKIGNRKIYRIVLIEKIGLDKVIELETHPTYCKWSRPQLENIISHYSLEKVKV